MIRLTPLLWTIALIDSALLASLAVAAVQHPGGHNDGGREMGLFFFVLLPAAVLGAAMLVFHFSPWWPVKAMALAVVLLPGLWFAKGRIEGWLVDRRVAADQSGRGYFQDDTLRQMGAAVVQRDLPTLLRLGATVDVNTPGRDMTLMRLAVDSVEPRRSDGSELPVVRALLSLGARADDAMQAACLRADSALLEQLLAAGGNPNLRVKPQRPLVFDTMAVLTPANFRLLAAQGLDLNSRYYGDPLPVQLAIYRRWDLLAIAIELGADLDRPRPDGRTVAGELASQLAEEAAAGRAAPLDLQRAQAALQAKLAAH